MNKKELQKLHQELSDFRVSVQQLTERADSILKKVWNLNVNTQECFEDNLVEVANLFWGSQTWNDEKWNKGLELLDKHATTMRIAVHMQACLNPEDEVFIVRDIGILQVNRNASIKQIQTAAYAWATHKSSLRHYFNIKFITYTILVDE